MRQLALSLAMIAAGATIASAQGHPGSHAGKYNHGPGHVRPDSATHAAMHALVHGDWTGTVKAHHGKTDEHMSVRFDSVLTVKTGNHTQLASQLSVVGKSFSWTQVVDGAACKASAERASDTLKGTFACPGGEWSFVLRRKT